MNRDDRWIGFKPVLPLWVVLLVVFLGGAADAQQAGTLEGMQGEVGYEATTGSSTWVGVAPLGVDRLRWTGSPASAVQGVFTVEVAAFDSGNRFRDENARLTVFESAVHPQARFRVDAFERTGGGPSTVVPEGRSTWQASGDLTLHGVTQLLSVPVVVVRQDDQVTAEASWSVSLEAFGMTAPTFLWLQVQDTVDVSVTLTGAWREGRP